MHDLLRAGLILMMAVHVGLLLGGSLSSLMPLIIGAYVLYVDFKSGKKS